MKSNLSALSVYNITHKYADNVNLLTPKHSDVDLSPEFNQLTTRPK